MSNRDDVMTKIEDRLAQLRAMKSEFEALLQNSTIMQNAANMTLVANGLNDVNSLIARAIEQRSTLELAREQLANLVAYDVKGSPK
jgi:hypothetical protein